MVGLRPAAQTPLPPLRGQLYTYRLVAGAGDPPDLRVDLGYDVTEQDADAAYVLFRFVPPGKQEATHGSLEIIRSGRQTKLLVQLAQLPSYYETVLRDGLLRKLRDDYGEPVGKPKEPAKSKKPRQAKEPEKTQLHRNQG